MISHFTPNGNYFRKINKIALKPFFWIPSLASCPLDAPQAIPTHIPAVIPPTRNTIRFAAVLLALVIIGGPSLPALAQPVGSVHQHDYDADNDGLIEVSSLNQLNAIRWDLNGDGFVDDGSNSDDYAAAFPSALSGMGCPSTGCDGYELTADLDFSDSAWNSGQSWIPIGLKPGGSNAFATSQFGAVFDGNGNSIRNLYINLHTIPRSVSGPVGLFRYTSDSAVIRNVGLESIDLFTGGNAQIAVGGLVGWNLGIITDSYVTGAVEASGGSVGGLVGRNQGTITASYSAADVNGGETWSAWQTGGLVGLNEGGIFASFATGDVSATDGYVGGLVGNHWTGGLWGTLSHGFLGNRIIEATTYGGNLDGHPQGVIIASYATGNVTGDTTTREVGGLAGRAAGYIVASYSLGRVSGTPYVTGEDRRVVGGLIGYCVGCSENSKRTVRKERTLGNVEWELVDVGVDSYWNTETSGQANSPYGLGKTGLELKQPTGYSGIYANWNVDLDLDGSPDDPWDFGTSDQYPVLKHSSLRPSNQRGGNDPAAIAITVDDTPRVTVTADNPLAVSEGGSNTYTLVLDSQPTHDVTITPTSGDDGAATVSPASHTFTSVNWHTARTFTVSGVSDEDTDDESVSVSHQAVSSDARYNGIAVGSVAVTVTDDDTPQAGTPPQSPYADLIGRMKEWRNDPQWVSYQTHTDRWDRTLLAFGETVNDATLTPMTASEAQGYADQGWSRWVEVAQALREIEGSAQQSEPQDLGQPPDQNDPPQQQTQDPPPPALHGSLIADVREWRNDPCCVSNSAHTDRWDRVLLSLGERVSDTSLSPMTASEAQGYADRGWTRWVGPARALNAVVTGTSGADTLSGTGSGELIVGLGGADTLSGQGGDDELRGGDGNDTYTGGAGRDRFVFIFADTGAKVITDFASGDVIVLKGNGWSSVGNIIASVQAVGTGNYRYNLAGGLTVETTNNRTLRTEDFVLED